MLRKKPAALKSTAIRLNLILMLVISPLGPRARMCGQDGPTKRPQVGAELERARELASAGRTGDAEALVREFLQTQRESAQGHFLLGYILFREIQDEAAAKGAMHYDVNEPLAKFRDAHARESLAEFTLGAKYAKPSQFDLKIVALDYILLDDSADADKWLTRAVEWDPNDADAWYNLGRTKYTENRFEEAIRAFRECLRLDPKNVKAEYNLGLSFDGLGRVDDALGAYKTAIAWQANLGQQDPEPYIDLGTLYLEQSRPNDALPYLRQATEIAPEDAKGHEKLGKTFSMLEELPEAQAELEKAVALAPGVASLHYMLGQVYRKEGMVDKAKAEFDRTAALSGTHSSDQKTMPAPK
ncbi:MAG TPA: tetratricopeptide repeat protein [Candidatus Cybelea sp.]|nr:tetratricopeptide repeat protein [Candidatus Cybelea sp.]